MNDKKIIELAKNKRSRYFYNRPHLFEQLINVLKKRGIDISQLNKKEVYYFIVNDVFSIPVCPVCQKKVKMGSNGKYRKFCSTKCSANSNSTVEKRIKTNIKKYGVENVFQSEKIKDKIKETSIEKRGVEHHMKLPKYKNFFREVNKELDRVKIAKSRNANTYERFQRFSEKLIPLFSKEEFIGGGYKNLYSWKCLKCNTIFEHWYHNGDMPKCPSCFKGSVAEREISEFLTHLKIDYKVRHRKLIQPFELDFIIPSQNIAIEFNGNYWHADKDEYKKNYHLNKTELCKKKGYRLIHIFEDEWIYKKQIVKNRLKHILKRTYYKIGGRKCQVKEIDTKIKNKFLNKYHIQGEDKSSVKLGAFYKNRLVAVMTFCKNRLALGQKNKNQQWELSRFATISAFTIIGIGSKLLKYFERNFEWQQIITYADIRWNIGNVYYNLGFKYSHSSKPNYWYIHNSNYLLRYHRFNFRKNVLNKKLKTFNKELSEWENMKRNGYDRIWDCGNLVFIKENPKNRNS